MEGPQLVVDGLHGLRSAAGFFLITLPQDGGYGGGQLPECVRWRGGHAEEGEEAGAGETDHIGLRGDRGAVQLAQLLGSEVSVVLGTLVTQPLDGR